MFQFILPANPFQVVGRFAAPPTPSHLLNYVPGTFFEIIYLTVMYLTIMYRLGIYKYPISSVLVLFKEYIAFKTTKLSGRKSVGSLLYVV